MIWNCALEVASCIRSCSCCSALIGSELWCPLRTFRVLVSQRSRSAFGFATLQQQTQARRELTLEPVFGTLSTAYSQSTRAAKAKEQLDQMLE